jgi:hypothetical protein
MELPRTIQVQLICDAPGFAPLSDVLVALDILSLERYYYGTVLGLTDAAGHLRVERSSLERDFVENQRLFPMDYRVSLAQCDHQIAVRVLGGQEFERAQTAAETNALMSDNVRLAWRRARNTALASTSVRIDLREHSRDEILVELPISQLKRSEPPV